VTAPGIRRGGGGVVPRARRPRDVGVMIVDDHPAVRSGLKSLIAVEPGLDPVAAVADPSAAMTAFDRLRPAVVIADYHLGARDGLSLCAALKAYNAPPRVLIFSAFADEQLAVASIIAGADGILDKTALGDELCAAIWALVRGERWHPPLSEEMVEAVAASLDPDDVALLRTLVDAGTPPGRIDMRARRSTMLARVLRRGLAAT
jgi:DNA-binding NarL/FixJ family response regulator